MKIKLVIVCSLLFLHACSKVSTKSHAKDEFQQTMQTHLYSIESKDIGLMQTTLPKSGDFYLTLPNGAISKSVDEFVKGQSGWFQQKGWSFSSKIIKQEHGKKYGYALVIADYREDDRNGKPYHHQMFISYDLKNVNGKWLVVKDHASTIKKSQ